MNTTSSLETKAVHLRGGWLPLVAAVLAGVVVAGMMAGLHLAPQLRRNYGHELRYNSAMFGPPIEQPIAFSHRVHATDKQIDCRYCHSYGDRGLNAGLPSVEKCLGCHNYIIPAHEEILKLKGYAAAGEEVPWTRVYYNPDHVFFPHYRHLNFGIACQKCHGEVEHVDRLRKVTFYMGFCIDCHTEYGAPRDCAACHQ